MNLDWVARAKASVRTQLELQQAAEDDKAVVLDLFHSPCGWHFARVVRWQGGLLWVPRRHRHVRRVRLEGDLLHIEDDRTRTWPWMANPSGFEAERLKGWCRRCEGCPVLVNRDDVDQALARRRRTMRVP